MNSKWRILEHRGHRLISRLEHISRFKASQIHAINNRIAIIKTTFHMFNDGDYSIDKIADLILFEDKIITGEKLLEELARESIR